MTQFLPFILQGFDFFCFLGCVNSAFCQRLHVGDQLFLLLGGGEVLPVDQLGDPGFEGGEQVLQLLLQSVVGILDGALHLVPQALGVVDLPLFDVLLHGSDVGNGVLVQLFQIGGVALQQLACLFFQRQALGEELAVGQGCWPAVLAEQLVQTFHGAGEQCGALGCQGCEFGLECGQIALLGFQRVEGPHAVLQAGDQGSGARQQVGLDGGGICRQRLQGVQVLFQCGDLFRRHRGKKRAARSVCGVAGGAEIGTILLGKSRLLALAGIVAETGAQCVAGGCKALLQGAVGGMGNVFPLAELVVELRLTQGANHLHRQGLD